MTSVEVSVFQEARNRIDRDISSIIQLLNEKKNTLFGEIAVLEDEFKSKQQQKQNSLKKLESLKVRMEEELRDNLLSEVQGCVTQDLQSGINKIRLETNSLTIDYTMQIDWVDKLNVVREKIKEFSIKTVPNTVSPAANLQTVPLSKVTKEKSKQYGFGVIYRTAVSQNNWTEWTDQNQGYEPWEYDHLGDDHQGYDPLEDDHQGYDHLGDDDQGYDPLEDDHQGYDPLEDDHQGYDAWGDD